MTFSDEMIALADSIIAGDDSLQTLEDLMDCKDLASLTVAMTPSNASLGNMLAHIVDGSMVPLQLWFLCGVRRVWKQHVIDDSKPISYGLLQIAGFGGYVLEPFALKRVMPIPREDVYEFLMRVDGIGMQRDSKWFQYIVCLQMQLPLGGVNDIYRAVLDHPHVTVVECIIKACMETKISVDIFSGDLLRRVLLRVTTPSRRRLRCGTRVEFYRSAILAVWISSWVDESAYAAVLLRDVIFNEILVGSDKENLDFELIGKVVSKTQSRLPYIPLSEDDLSRVPIQIQKSSRTWKGIVECVRRLPPANERVEHPVWAVRRHY